MPIMPQYRSPYGQSIAELLMRQGDAAARAAERSGMLWGNAVQNIGQIGAQAYEQHAEQQEIGKRDAALSAFVDSGAWRDPAVALSGSIKILGPRGGVQFASGLQAAAKMMGGDPAEAAKSLPVMAKSFLAAPDSFKPTLYGNLRGLLEQANLVKPGQLPETFSPDLLPMFQAYAGDEAAPKTRQVEIQNPDGSKSIQIVEDKPGQTFTSAAEAPKPDTRSLDARYAEAVATENQAEAQKLLAAKARLEAAGRAPAGAGSKIWVVRNGQTIRIGENEYQPGDQPTGQRERPVTGAERRTLSFYMRAQEASDNIAPLEDTVRKLNLAEQTQLQWAPNLLQSTDNQLYRQAQRAFTEARLRKDSGATIKKDEYESDAKTYFAQPGDSDEMLEQKRRGRAKILEALKVEAGRAYVEHFGEDPNKPEDLPDPLGLRGKR